MQLKLLNFHKMLANIATNLVGAFISLIIYQASGSLVLPCIYLLCMYTVRLLCNIALRKFYFKCPQLLLLLRVIPMLFYNIFILLLDVNLILGVVGTCIFVGINDSINICSKEVILNYSSMDNSGSNSLGITRLFEQAGVIIAFVVGGFLLDVNTTLVVCISMGIYIISVIPLFIYYIHSRKSKSFNQDATSNAIIAISKNPNLSSHRKKLVKSILRDYFIVYFMFGFVDVLNTTFNLYLFITGGAFATAGIFSAIFNIAYAVGAYVFGKINDKHDTTILVSFACIVIAIATVILPFIDNIIVTGTIFALIGLCLPTMSIFVLQRMMIKSRILGISNNALMARENACVASYMTIWVLGLATAVICPLIPIFIGIGASMVGSAYAIPKNEERTRKKLVDFLQDNEI